MEKTPGRSGKYHKSTALSVEEKIRLALMRLQPLVERRPRLAPLRKVIQTLRSEGKQLSTAAVSRAIAQVLRDGHIEVKVRQLREPMIKPSRVGWLEQELAQTFEGLTRAIVVDVEPSSADFLSEDDLLHKQLGGAMAEVLADGSCISDNETVGVGSGRGVYYTLDCLKNFPSLRARNVALVSLTGAMDARTYTQRTNLVLDADIHLGLLGMCFAYGVRLCPISHPIAYESSVLAQVRRRTQLDREVWAGNRPTVAIVGVGTLGAGHRFYREVTENWKIPILEPIFDDLKELVSDCRDCLDFSGGRYCPVGDICNRLFFIPPPPGRDYNLAVGTRKRIEGYIRKINDHLVTATEEQLAEIETIILIAGGPRKMPAVRHLLLDQRYRIKFLCTDKQTAAQLLESATEQEVSTEGSSPSKP